jgi:DNA-binding protein YbaB
MIQDALAAAFQDCISQIEKDSQEAMGAFGNMGFGGLF